jgi:hypothetical protein
MKIWLLYLFVLLGAVSTTARNDETMGYVPLYDAAGKPIDVGAREVIPYRTIYLRVPGVRSYPHGIVGGPRGVRSAQ